MVVGNFHSHAFQISFSIQGVSQINEKLTDNEFYIEEYRSYPLEFKDVVGKINLLIDNEEEFNLSALIRLLKVKRIDGNTFAKKIDKTLIETPNSKNLELIYSFIDLLWDGWVTSSEAEFLEPSEDLMLNFFPVKLF